MAKKVIYIELSDYNYWANKKMCGFLSQLDPDLLDREVSSSFPTLRKTLGHIYDGEFLWLERMEGRMLDYWPSEKLGNDFEALKEGVLEASKNLMGFVARQKEEVFTQPCHYKDIKGREWSQVYFKILTHVFNHSTFHRGQLVTMMRQVGFTDLSSTDYIYFMRQQEMA